MDTNSVRVWDPLVRVGHWLLVLAFAVAYLTEGDPMPVHVWAGYLVATIVVVRVVWGLIGPRHARFSDFLYSPAAAARYLVDLFRRRAPRYLGHSPAGGLMVVALLACLAATTFTGMMTLADVADAGPLAPWFGNEAVAAQRAAAEAAGQAFRYRSPYEGPHEFFANLTLLLVILHVGGVALASFAHWENLARAMVTGRKRAADHG